MREILFRGKHKHSGEWIFGCYVNNEAGCFIFPNDTLDSVDNFIIDPKTLGQYVGLLDKNSKKIFEGDILSADEYPFISEGEQNYVATVEWIYGSWDSVLNVVGNVRGISDGSNSSLFFNGEEEGEVTPWEILGNIHDNADFLGKERENGE